LSKRATSARKGYLQLVGRPTEAAVGLVVMTSLNLVDTKELLRTGTALFIQAASGISIAFA